MTTRALTGRVREFRDPRGIARLGAQVYRHDRATTAVRYGIHVKELQDTGGWASPALLFHYARAAEVANAGVKLGEEME